MSAEVVGSHAAPSAPARAAPRPAAPLARLVEPSLVNRLLGVAVAVFAVPALLELRRLAGAGAQGGPTPVQEAWLFAACSALAAVAALVLLRLPRLPALRAGRALCALLALEAALLGGALLARLTG